MQNKDSLRSRYLYKLGGSLINLPLTIIITALVPRGLGPVAYGNYGFLTHFFRESITVLDTGTSVALYAKLSRRPSETALIKFYLQFAILILLFLLLSTATIIFCKIDHLLWPHQEIQYVWMALVFGYLSWFATVIQRVIDAFGFTKKGEIVKVIQKLLSVILLGTLFFTNHLGLTEFFIYQYIIVLFIILCWIKILHNNGIILFFSKSNVVNNTKQYIKEFYIYSAPLFMITVVGFLASTFERWILQRHSGSIEQGYYNISFQISAFCILFTSAMTPLIMREFAIAYGKDDIRKLRQLFIDIVPVLVTIATYFSLFLMFQADKIVVFVAGGKFQGAYLPVAIMTMFPIYQAYNQLNGSLLKATNQTKRFRDIGISMAIIGIPISYFLLASRGYLGLNLGASGLAVKIVALQIITVNLRLWFNAKYLKLNFLLYLFHQFFILFAFSILSLVAKTISDFIISQSICAFLLAGLIYTILIMSLLYCFPQTLFMTRDTLQKKYIQALIGLFKRRGSAP